MAELRFAIESVNHLTVREIADAFRKFAEFFSCNPPN
jgi:hypothetical protein